MNRQDIDELTEVFLEESEEIVENLNKDVLTLEQYVEQPDTLDRELINNIFRYVHTLKGNSGLAGADKLRDLAHKLESLLDRLRKDKLKITSDMVDVMFEGIDRFNDILQEIKSGQDAGVEIADLIDNLDIILSGGTLVAVPGTPPTAAKHERRPPSPPTRPASSGSPRAASGIEAFTLPDDIKRILTEYEETRLLDNLSRHATIYELILNLMMDGFDRVVTAVIAGVNTIGEVIAKVPSSKTLPNYELQVRIILASPAPQQAVLDVLNALDDIASQDFALRALTIPKEPLPVFREAPLSSALTEPRSSLDDLLKSVAADMAEEREQPRPPKPSAPPQRSPSKKPASKAASARPAASATAPSDDSAERSDKTTAAERDALDSAGNVVRVDIKKLDNLMNIVGELVLAKARYVQLESELDTLGGQKPLQEDFKRINKFTSKKLEDLREGILQVRMVQVSTLFNRFPRLVRDLAKKHNKQIRLVVEGRETELDKAVVDKMGDPLMHLIKNAADHGVEEPHVRLEKGKPEMGTITLRAYQEGSYIVIQVVEDGAGLNIDRIRQKAVENGLIEKGLKLSDQEILNFIFHPGFSTAQQITDTSGRGVGMDAVKTEITKLKGIIDIQTAPDAGTRFIIKLPLTLAIIQVLLIQAGHHTYAIPLSSVTESFELDPQKIELIDAQEVTQLRHVVLPLLRLTQAFHIPENGHGARPQSGDRRRQFVVVIALAEKKIGLVVDDLLGQQEIVIKPLGRYLLRTPGFAGATTLGNGRVVLILDVVSLIENLNMKKLERQKKRKKTPAKPAVRA